MDVFLRLSILLTILSTRAILATPVNEYSTIETPSNVEEEQHVNEKTPIYLNLSRGIPSKIRVEGVARIFGANHYMVRPEYYETHRIGEVKDGVEVLFDDNARILERVVYFCREDDGTNIARAIDFCTMDDGSIVTETSELVKKPGSINYVPLVRYPIDIDVLTQKNTSTVRVQGDLRSQATFKLLDRMTNHAYIGIVKCGGQIVHKALSNDIFVRDITFNSLGKEPTILVKTYMKDGVCIHSKYQFSYDKMRFRLVHEDTRDYT
ncbi:signal peptide containing protein [Theileria equi strain WA]|uniref:Signal peptide containing protein n=1 Tax=Theileria equi strain WA TaxID=1537102 RepID=L1LAS1_THEEQ|nr:signal peptide containing protein [Theileria equi strain WA]EKX72375.1 signal peptide containing protein [Theileria equi strain WA]|eukprot:XP_004831827.1 signal peptide containing protein [Theileria equi strain WA]